MAQDTRIKWLSSSTGTDFALGKGRFETFIATTAVVAGDVVSLDTSDTDWQNIVPRGAATGGDSVPLGVALESAAAGERCMVALSGFVDCQVESTTDIAVGDPLTPSASTGFDYLVKATVGTNHVVAWALEARTDNDTGIIAVQWIPQG